jgi:hypothetical protein
MEELDVCFKFRNNIISKIIFIESLVGLIIGNSWNNGNNGGGGGSNWKTNDIKSDVYYTGATWR